jgi:hypothetical protein
MLKKALIVKAARGPGHLHAVMVSRGAQFA